MNGPLSLPLRWRLPLALAVVLLLVGALSVANAWRQRGEALSRDVEQRWLREAAHLARALADGVDSRELQQDMAHIATAPGVRAVAVIGHDGRIVAAQRRAWVGRSPDVLPGWDATLADAARGRASAVTRWDAAQWLRLTQQAQLPGGDPASPRGRAAVLVWISYDATEDFAGMRAQVLRARAPDLAGIALIVVVLGLVLHRRLAGPLDRLVDAMTRFQADETVPPLRASGAPEIRRATAAFNDLAERVRAARAAQQASEERLAMTLYSTGDAMMATDADQRVTLLNPAATALTGWTEAEARGRPVGDVFVIEHAISGEPAEIPVARVIAEGRVVGLANHTVLVARDGTRRHIADSAAPVRDAQGRLQGVVLVFRDVSEQWRLERQLETREAHYRALADQGPALVWLLDATGRPVWVNRRWRDFVAAPEGQPLETGWEAACHPDDRTAVRAMVARAIDQGQACEGLLRLRRHDGVWRWMTLHGLPRRDTAGVADGFVLAFTDVTLQREHDAKRAAELDELHRWQRATLGREARIGELKREVNALLAAQGHPPRYTEPDGSSESTR